MGQNRNKGRTPANANPQTELYGGPDSGKLAISLSKDNLEVRADFIPPPSGGQPLGTAGVRSILDKINVTYGVRWEDIKSALDECNIQRVEVKDVIIARGEPPTDEVAEYYSINPLLTQSPQLKEMGGRIDFRERSPFVVVKKGQTLAQMNPRIPGRGGVNVHGESLPFSQVKPESFAGGANTRTENGRVTSEINGQFVQVKNVLSVQKTLLVKGGVGYGTGNISFPGDVVIEGPVSDGFKIFSGGSVTVKQTFDVTEAVTKGDLVVGGGIIGRGAGLLKTGGGIRTKFIENCRAAARKSIMVDRDIVNSSIFTLEQIGMGDKGIILGSDIYAIHGVKTSGIGRKAGKSSHIHCGIDFTVQQEKDKLNSRLRILTMKLAKLGELMADDEIPAEKQAQMKELLRRLEEEQQHINSRLTELLGRVNADENAVVEVSGEIIPGTIIEICQIALYVSEPLRKVRIRLDRRAGKLISEPL